MQKILLNFLTKIEDACLDAKNKGYTSLKIENVLAACAKTRKEISEHKDQPAYRDGYEHLA